MRLRTYLVLLLFAVCRPAVAADSAPAPKEALPYAKGDSEAALDIALAGSGEDFYFGVGPSYAYYVVNRLAVGAYLQYTHIFANTHYDYRYPESMAVLPFLKFAILRSRAVSPYLLVIGGYEGEWGSRSATNGWALGLGGGVHVGLGKSFAINIQLIALHTWYDSKKIYRYADGDLVKDANGNRHKCEAPGCFEDPAITKENVSTAIVPDTNGDGEPDLGLYNSDSGYRCTDPESCPFVNDQKDVRREWLFPLITIGVTYFF